MHARRARHGAWVSAGKLGWMLAWMLVQMLSQAAAQTPSNASTLPPQPGAALREVRIPSRDGTLITGWWLPARGTASADAAPAAPRGVVLLLHGCGGLYSSARERAGQLSYRHGGLAQRISDQGLHVVLPDSLTARGERSLCEQRIGQRKIDQRQRRDDVLGTLQWLAVQPWADVSRVGLLGWSHGGSAVLSATDLTHAAVRAAAVRPLAAVAFYPGCSDALQRGYQPSAPLLMLLGDKDDWTPPAPCIELGRAVGATVQVYADSHHGFDDPSGSVRHRPEVPNGVNPGQGVHVGRNPVTGPQAWDAAVARLRAALLGDDAADQTLRNTKSQTP